MVMVGAIMLMAVNGAIGQQQGAGPADYGGGYAVPGVPGISLGPGTNTVALSVSIASQQDSQIYFQVNSFALMDSQTQAFTVYDLSSAMPGIMDTSNNRVQIDIGKLQSSITSTSNAAMDDLYSMLRPSVNSLMVVADISQQGQQGTRATFQVERLTVIMPDGQTNEFDLSQPMSIVVDGAARRIFAVGFDQMYSLVNTYIVNIQNNYYTEINYNIVTGPVIVVTPPAVYPVLTPIRFPASWPVFYPVPVPVPIPVVSVRPHPPSVTPTMKPTMGPTVSPTMGPTISPTVKPTKGPTKMPTVSPQISPTTGPTKRPVTSPKASLIATKRPVISPGASISPSIMPTRRPAGTISPSMFPTKRAGPSLIATKKATPTFQATKMPGIATKRPISATYRPTTGPITRPTIKATKAPVGGGARRPIATTPATPRMPAGDERIKRALQPPLSTIVPGTAASPSPSPTVTIRPTKII
jgi:hypothetical protein